MDCFIPNFNLKYEDSENIKAVSRFQLASNQTSGVFCFLLFFFRGGPVYIYKMNEGEERHASYC